MPQRGCGYVTPHGSWRLPAVRPHIPTTQCEPRHGRKPDGEALAGLPGKVWAWVRFSRDLISRRGGLTPLWGKGGAIADVFFMGRRTFAEHDEGAVNLCL